MHSAVKVTSDSLATFYPKNRFSLKSVILFSISKLIFKNNKKLRLTSGIRVLTLKKKKKTLSFGPKLFHILGLHRKSF